MDNKDCLEESSPCKITLTHVINQARTMMAQYLTESYNISCKNPMLYKIVVTGIYNYIVHFKTNG